VVPATTPHNAPTKEVSARRLRVPIRRVGSIRCPTGRKLPLRAKRPVTARSWSATAWAPRWPTPPRATPQTTTTIALKTNAREACPTTSPRLRVRVVAWAERATALVCAMRPARPTVPRACSVASAHRAIALMGCAATPHALARAKSAAASPRPPRPASAVRWRREKTPMSNARPHKPAMGAAAAGLAVAKPPKRPAGLAPPRVRVAASATFVKSTAMALSHARTPPSRVPRAGHARFSAAAPRAATISSSTVRYATRAMFYAAATARGSTCSVILEPATSSVVEEHPAWVRALPVEGTRARPPVRAASSPP